MKLPDKEILIMSRDNGIDSGYFGCPDESDVVNFAKEIWNLAIEKAAESSETMSEFDSYGVRVYKVDKQSILKLKYE